MRSVIRLLLLLTVLILVSPFFISSLLIDQRGVTISGHVVAKHEYIVEHYASWNRIMEVSLQYDPPDGPGGVAYLDARLASESRFDDLKKGDSVPLHYLRQTDLPDLPGSKTLRQMHVVPMVRLADQDTWSGVRDLAGTHSFAVSAVVIVALALLLWKALRIPFFGWGVATCVIVAIVVSIISEFPRPTAPPEGDVRQAEGVIKSLDRWDSLFEDNHNRGLIAVQPIQIAAVQFVPNGRIEPVVAVDLIDNGSISGLHEQSPVTVEYESAHPRVAHIKGATRRFAQRNLTGIWIQAIAAILVIGGLFLVARLFSAAMRAQRAQRVPPNR